MTEISSKHSEIILKKMCWWIGVDYKSVDWTDREWFLQHTWTADQELKFIDWVAEFLIRNKYAAKLGLKNARHQAQKIVANYGWKTTG